VLYKKIKFVLFIYFSNQNSFRVAAWILERPNVAVFFGCVGNDKYSDILKKKARDDGVNVLYQITDKTPTGTCGVLITGTRRSLIANLAAANHFTLDHLNKPENVIYLDKADYFYISVNVFVFFFYLRLNCFY